MQISPLLPTMSVSANQVLTKGNVANIVTSSRIGSFELKWWLTMAEQNLRCSLAATSSLLEFLLEREREDQAKEESEVKQDAKWQQSNNKQS